MNYRLILFALNAELERAVATSRNLAESKTGRHNAMKYRDELSRAIAEVADAAFADTAGKVAVDRDPCPQRVSVPRMDDFMLPETAAETLAQIGG